MYKNACLKGQKNENIQAKRFLFKIFWGIILVDSITLMYPTRDNQFGSIPKELEPACLPPCLRLERCCRPQLCCSWSPFDCFEPGSLWSSSMAASPRSCGISNAEVSMIFLTHHTQTLHVLYAIICRSVDPPGTPGRFSAYIYIYYMAVPWSLWDMKRS